MKQDYAMSKKMFVKQHRNRREWYICPHPNNSKILTVGDFDNSVTEKANENFEMFQKS